jgi:hypothetical protein
VDVLTGFGGDDDAGFGVPFFFIIYSGVICFLSFFCCACERVNGVQLVFSVSGLWLFLGVFFFLFLGRYLFFLWGFMGICTVLLFQGYILLFSGGEGMHANHSSFSFLLYPPRVGCVCRGFFFFFCVQYPRDAWTMMDEEMRGGEGEMEERKERKKERNITYKQTLVRCVIVCSAPLFVRCVM